MLVLDLHSCAPFDICELRDVSAEACVIDRVSSPENGIMLTASSLRATHPTTAGIANLCEHGVLL